MCDLAERKEGGSGVVNGIGFAQSGHCLGLGTLAVGSRCAGLVDRGSGLSLLLKRAFRCLKLIELARLLKRHDQPSVLQRGQLLGLDALLCGVFGQAKPSRSTPLGPLPPAGLSSLGGGPPTYPETRSNGGEEHFDAGG